MRILARCRNIWPIDSSAGKKPEGWPGWPEGKQFALVITHDVEGQLGLDRCRALMDFDARRGFRSSFNFVPEGEYRVPEALRTELTQAGFEVGVHGLFHDGKLYNSRRIFSERAGVINRYLKEWGAVGFRSPFMHHNLDWIHDLDVLYDSSTFDTDPFEPQPDGVGTVFPFWVPGRDGRPGYVELPYTLPQDFTLFTIFRQTTIETWTTKLDWVADRGGMALVNIHPDYLGLDRQGRARDQYSRELADQFLAYIKTRFAGAYWNVLPRDIALFVAGSARLSMESTGRKSP